MEEINLPLSQPHPTAMNWSHGAPLCAWCTGAEAAEHFHFSPKDPLEVAGVVELSTASVWARCGHCTLQGPSLSQQLRLDSVELYTQSCVLLIDLYWPQISFS